MKKLLAALTILSALLTASPVYAQSCDSLSKVEVLSQAKEAELRVLDLTDVPMQNFMAYFEKMVGPSPVPYDNVIILYNAELAMIVLTQEGCVAIKTRPFAVGVIRDYLREARLDDGA